MIYLDNAATSFCKPKEVVSAVTDALTCFSANPGRSGHDLSVKAAEKVYEARVALDTFFNGFDSSNVCFTLNCTTALNTAIKGVLKRGDHVVISCLEHNSVVRPVHRLSQLGIIEYSVFDVGKSASETVKNFKEKLRKNTKLCIVTAVSNVFGNILPIKELSIEAHNNKALFFVDGAQGAGVIDINVKNQGIDCLCIPGHKGLLGPMGTGALLHNGIAFDTLFEGGTGTESFNLDQPNDYPERLEAGTLNLPGICGLSAGVKFLERYGVGNVYRKEKFLTSLLTDGLKNIKNIILYDEDYNPEEFAPVVSFNVKNMHSEQVSRELNKQRIAVRGGYHCAPLAHNFMRTSKVGAVRISPSFYNTAEDINILLNLVEKIAFNNYI